ncbi:MAG: hypothetical protein H3C35_12965 [Bacteroidetes bacterium]|nr:hypothetical protein [Bacteroidota bacterium]
MKTVQKNLDDIISDQKLVSTLSLEVEKVLRFYEEHPNYPLDYEKLRSKVQEVYARINRSINDLQTLQQAQSSEQQKIRS